MKLWWSSYMILWGYMAKKCKKMQKFRNPTVKTKNMCGTNEKIQLGNTSVIKRKAIAMQNSEVCTTVAPSFCIVSNSKGRWVTPAIIIYTIITIFATRWHLHHYHQLKKCQRFKQKAPKIWMTIVYINILKLIVKLMKIRNSKAGKYFNKRKKSLLKCKLSADTTLWTGESKLWIIIDTLSLSTSRYPTSLKNVDEEGVNYVMANTSAYLLFLLIIILSFFWFPNKSLFGILFEEGVKLRLG